ncbi:MAG: AzlC family ABC transporter permease [Desulfovibrionaceae bacterium]|nr:AzlC family ABC transporter permease [Desulfovibrionaceae bacterium]
MTSNSPTSESARSGQASAFRLGASRSLPIVLGYAPVAFAFGVLTSQAGMPVSLATAMSLIVFSGSGQFIAVAMWFSGAGYVATAAAVFVTNLRYLLMSMALAPHVSALRGLQRLCFGWQITDELFAVHITAFRQGWQINRTAIFSATFLAQASWTIGTMIGALCGSIVTDVKPLGLDFALSSMFLALLIPQCTDRLHILTALLAAIFSVSLRAAGLGSWNVVLASVLAAGIGTLLSIRTQPLPPARREEKA